MNDNILADFVTEEKLAVQLGHHPRSLARWRQRQIGPPHVTNGRYVLYNIEAVRAWLAAGGTTAAAAKRQRKKY
jgi:hypothetical protein